MASQLDARFQETAEVATPFNRVRRNPVNFSQCLDTWRKIHARAATHDVLFSVNFMLLPFYRDLRLAWLVPPADTRA